MIFTYICKKGAPRAPFLFFRKAQVDNSPAALSDASNSFNEFARSVVEALVETSLTAVPGVT